MYIYMDWLNRAYNDLEQWYGGQSSRCKFQSSNFDGGYTQQNIPSSTQRYIEAVNKYLYDKVLNLANDPKEHFNLGLHITQNQ